MSPPTGTGNHGANALPVRGNVQVEAPEGPHRRAPARRAEDRADDVGRDEDDGGWVSLGGSLFSDRTQPKFVINPDPTPVAKSRRSPVHRNRSRRWPQHDRPKICGEIKKRKSEGTVRPFCGSTKGPIRFVLPQKGETKRKLMTKNRILVSREHDTMSRGEGEGGGKAGRA